MNTTHNGTDRIEVGAKVYFPSKSSSTGSRVGTVLRVTGTRAQVSYKFNYGRQAAPKWVALVDCKPVLVW